ncbi:hypothetical protein IWQ62_004950 [Dispira parvispora]|uniref:Uncharacterized protein n=1 Tax=Dispira parvispora TaxID=1520584 RepID=A0A9W8E5P3_9FUNG|nr:hypothetical protein IWQ62_004950 [Dispira parvispora]
METRAYQLLRVPSEDSVLNLPLPPGFSGKPFVEIPGGFTKADYEEKLLYIFSQIKDDLSQRFTKFPGNKKLKSLLGSSTRKLKLDRPRFPLPAFIRDTVNGYRSEASYSPYVAQNATIVLLHCRNRDPTSYYSLVWHPDHPKYTATTLLSHLAVTYDAKKLFMYETSATFGGTLARVRRSLASHNANLCTDDVSKFKVVFTYHH